MDEVIPPATQSFDSYFKSIGFNRSMCLKAINICEKEDIQDVDALLNCSEPELKEIGFTMGLIQKLRAHLTIPMSADEFLVLYQNIKKYAILHSKDFEIIQKDFNEKKNLLEKLKKEVSQKELEFEKWKERNSKIESLLKFPSTKMASHSKELICLMRDLKKIKYATNITKFNPEFCSPLITLSNNNLVAYKNGITSTWQGTVLGTFCREFTIKVLSNNQDFMIGFASQDINLDGTLNHGKNGYYLHGSSGTLFAEDGTSSKPYAKACYSDGNVITCQWSEVEDISFIINGKNCGIAYKNINKELYPCLLCGPCKCQIQFVEKKKD